MVIHRAYQEIRDFKKFSANGQLCGYIKLELLKGGTKLNHFAIKAKLYVHAIRAAYAKLCELNPVSLAA